MFKVEQSADGKIWGLVGEHPTKELAESHRLILFTINQGSTRKMLYRSSEHENNSAILFTS